MATTRPEDADIPVPAAILWDMDGTIVDSEPYWMNAETELARQHGVEWTHEHALLMVGNALPVSAEILQRHGVDLGTREIVDTLTRRVVEQTQESIPWRPGARELLLDARTRGIPCALVTMSEEPFARAIVDALPEGTFDSVVTGDRVERGKPHPDAYELGFAELAERNPGLDPARTVAIEDSWPGYQASTAAGFPTLAVPLHAPLPEDPSRVEWDSLEGRSAADVARAVLPARQRAGERESAG
ncbi:HAD family hydrolase [Arthrobacter sp. UM1]|uniref:HAD family hydrolase n=1 Tax=Arthrobacter sp. UM1 TaxID=2766776 RepID=UPI001CF6AD84|nr:HAD family phosphatase [Arthrobacter sp. UM1]MCB4207503.1 HAD family phosphatase [Arthrobacter sp. UM1]